MVIRYRISFENMTGINFLFSLISRYSVVGLSLREHSPFIFEPKHSGKGSPTAHYSAAPHHGDKIAISNGEPHDERSLTHGVGIYVDGPRLTY